MCVLTFKMKKKERKYTSSQLLPQPQTTLWATCILLFLRSGSCSASSPRPPSPCPSSQYELASHQIREQGRVGRKWELPLKRGSGQHSVKCQPLAVRAGNCPSPPYCLLLRMGNPGPKGDSMGSTWGFLGDDTITHTITHTHTQSHTKSSHIFLECRKF